MFYVAVNLSIWIRFPAKISKAESATIGYLSQVYCHVSGLEMYKEVQVPVILSEETSRRPSELKLP